MMIQCLIKLSRWEDHRSNDTTGDNAWRRSDCRSSIWYQILPSSWKVCVASIL